MKVVVSYVFNGPMLIPWGIVEGVSDDDMLETILSWQETKRMSHRYSENDFVAEVNNPLQKMTLRRILRKPVMVGDEKRRQIVGFECYWWHDYTDGLPRNMGGARPVPGQIVEEEI